MATSNKNRRYRGAALDQIVATYAPIGAEQKRKRARRQTIVASSCLVAIGAVALIASTDIALLENMASVLPQRAPAMSTAELAKLAKERAEFAVKIEELEAQIGIVRSQKNDLEAQRAAFADRSQQLAVLLDRTDIEQSTLERRQQQGSQLDQEIAAIAAQRKALAERWAQFEAQGELLAMEIIAVNAQRKELESQRRQIDRQRQELAEMLEKADELYRRNTRAAGIEPEQNTSTTALGEADDDESFIATPNSLMVDNRELDGMRGGFSIGEGLDVSFGFQQTGSVNGVEQFRNSFSIDSMASGVDSVDMSNMNSVILQNGNGNFVSANVLDSLSESFGNVIQNTLDDQIISTTTIYDISLLNIPGTLQGLSGEQALMDTLGSF